MPFPDAAALTRRITGRLGEPVTLYPVRAEEVAAYLARGLSGSTINAIPDRRPVQMDIGGSGVVSTEVVLMADESITSTFKARRSSFAWKGQIYDIVRIEPDDPGGVICYTTELV